MANQIVNVQLSFPGGVKSPVNTGDKRMTAVALSKLIRSGLIGGHSYGLSGSGSYLEVATGVVAASATATCATVVTGNTISIAGTALTAAQKRASATVTCATALADQTVTINGQVFTAVAGAATLGDATFSIDTGNTQTATSLAAQVNAYAGGKVAGLVAAKSSSAVVTLYAVTQGTAGNSLTLVSSDGGTLAVTGSGTLANGAALTNNTFDFVGTDATTGDALAAAIIASTTAAVQQVTATSDGAGVVTITSKVAGVAGNAITLTSVGGTITVTGSGFLASGDNGTITRWYCG
jgi:hypothetical protein